jgi:lipopolysaccharide transport system ATP-binding protein
MDSVGDVVIRVEGLGKKYTLHHQQKERHNTLRDSLSHQAAAFGRWINPFTLSGQIRKARQLADRERAEREEEFWALKDVSFEIRRGERVGIIGRNGAGKSTLLKILSRITEPTTGRVEIHGRVASLLEVGTGFHPELTGRENIFLNGAILGMTRREIRMKFDEIVEFAEVDKFLDTPVKRYSSGMYVRLAFAVAAHLEPEILVVDEVLAVGDASFQKKCLGKMEQVSNLSMRTVLFVSHNLSAITSLCQKGILLEKGRLKMPMTEIYDAVDEYMGSTMGNSAYTIDINPKDKRAWITRAIVSNALDAKSSCLRVGDPIQFDVSYRCNSSIYSIGLGVGISRPSGSRITSFNNYILGIHLPTNSDALNRIRIVLDDLNLAPGSYVVSLSLVENETQWLDLQTECISFSIVDDGFYIAGRSLTREQGEIWCKPQYVITSN